MIRKTPAVRTALVLATLVLGTLAGPASAQQPAIAATQRGPVMRQMTLLVEDMDKSLEFYLRLGLSKASDRTFEEKSDEAMFNPTDLPLTADPKVSRHVILKGGSDVGMIGLLTYDHPRLSSARGNLAALGSGDIIITIEVPDIADTYRRLNQVDTRFQRTPYRFNFTAADGTHQSTQRMLAFDPDGHLTEIIQAGTITSK